VVLIPFFHPIRKIIFLFCLIFNYLQNSLSFFCCKLNQIKSKQYNYLIINYNNLVFGAISYFLPDCAKNPYTFLAQSRIYRPIKVILQNISTYPAINCIFASY